MERISDYIIEKRVLFLLVISLVSIFFIYRAAQIKVYTIFSDLLPQQHEYINVYNEIRAKFGGANTTTMVLQVREGDIFNPTTLQRIRDITDELYLIPAVDRFKINSIAVNTAVDMKLTSGGYEFQPLMFPNVPKTQEEAEKVREALYASVFYGSFVLFKLTADSRTDEIGAVLIETFLNQ